jgi:hypothetical protein
MRRAAIVNLVKKSTQAARILTVPQIKLASAMAVDSLSRRITSSGKLRSVRARFLRTDQVMQPKLPESHLMLSLADCVAF